MSCDACIVACRHQADPDRSLYLQAILAGQRTPAFNVALEALRGGMGVIDFYTELLQPAQYELGRLRETNRITVARDHMAIPVTQFVVAQLYSRFDMPATQRGLPRNGWQEVTSRPRDD